MAKRAVTACLLLATAVLGGAACGPAVRVPVRATTASGEPALNAGPVHEGNGGSHSPVPVPSPAHPAGAPHTLEVTRTGAVPQGASSRFPRTIRQIVLVPELDRAVLSLPAEGGPCANPGTTYRLVFLHAGAPVLRATVHTACNDVLLPDGGHRATLTFWFLLAKTLGLTIAQLVPGRAPPPPVPPPPSPFLPASVAFWSADRGLLAGEEGCPQHCRGMIEATADGGRTWTVRYRTVPPYDHAISVTITGKMDGWAVASTCYGLMGHVGNCRAELLFTPDGGQTWGIVGHALIFAPSFPTPRLGWALSAPLAGSAGPDQLLATDNGGRTWHTAGPSCPRQGQWSFAQPYGVLNFATPQRGWIACVGEPATDMAAKEILTTDDAGRTWHPVTQVSISPHQARVAGTGGLSIVGMPVGLFALPDGHAWLWESRGFPWATTDGGGTWQALNPGLIPDCIEVNSLSFASDSTGFALRWDCAAGPSHLEDLMQTHDGGRTWKLVTVWPGPVPEGGSAAVTMAQSDK